MVAIVVHVFLLILHLHVYNLSYTIGEELVSFGRRISRLFLFSLLVVSIMCRRVWLVGGMVWPVDHITYYHLLVLLLD